MIVSDGATCRGVGGSSTFLTDDVFLIKRIINKIFITHPIAKRNPRSCIISTSGDIDLKTVPRVVKTCLPVAP